MSNVVEERPDGSIAFSLDGDLQFDSRDEAIYHENLVLPALTLARRRGLDNLRVLICGGGDGLALREVLRFPGVASVDLVDMSAEVLDVGRTRFADLNDHAFADPRVSVHVQDAWSFLATSPDYDVIVADFSIPRKSDEARVFSSEWYASAKTALSPLGVMAVNAVSPQVTPAAFWCQVRSIRAAGMRAVPYRSCIPSFRDRGYGAWGVILASPAPLSKSIFRRLECPVPTRQANLDRLWRAARFSRAERMLGHLVPVHRLERPCLVNLLLNGRIETPIADPWANLPQPLKGLFEALPISHPYHTRLMVQTLAESIIGDLSRLRLRNLLDELLRRAARLPKAIADELLVLKHSVAEWASWQNWNAKVLGALILVLTLANTLAPDHAFAKGHAAFGHAAMSRSGSFGRSGTMGHASPVTAMSIHSSGFRSGSLGGTVNGQHFASDMEGDFHPTHIYFYNHYGGYGYGYNGYGYGYPANQGYPANAPQQQQPAPHTPVFVADDDVLVMDNGDVLVTLTPTAYLVIADGHMELMGASKAPLITLALDPEFASSIQQELDGRQQNARAEAKLRRDWLSWVNWTAAILPGTKADQREAENLETLQATLSKAKKGIGNPALAAYQKPENATLLFQGCYLYDSSVQFRLADGSIVSWDGTKLTDPAGKTITQTPPELKEVFKSILSKLAVDIKADVKSNTDDRAQIESYEASLQSDKSSYQSLMANGADYSVDYGTDEISASLAVSLTDRDIAQNALDRADNIKEANQLTADTRRIEAASQWFK